MPDKVELIPHQRKGNFDVVCGQDMLASCGMDKGYYSTANHKYLQSLEGLKAFCLQQPGLEISRLGEDAAETYTRLVNRRSGIEPLIGHAKQDGQLGQSRMKTDETTLAAGYGAIGGFNLRQLRRHLLGKDIKPMG
jgi:transposase, IS5 family